MPTEAQPNSWPAFALGLLASVGLAVFRWLPKRRKDQHDNDASLEEIRNKGIVALLDDYRQQVGMLRAELLAQGVRHSQAVNDASARYDVLEAEHEKVVQELYEVRSQLRSLQTRMDAE